MPLNVLFSAFKIVVMLFIADIHETKIIGGPFRETDKEIKTGHEH